MLDYVYIESSKDYVLKENEVNRAEFLLNTEKNPYYKSLGLNKDILFEEKTLNQSAINQYFTQYLLGFQVEIKTTKNILIDKNLGILKLEYGI